MVRYSIEDTTLTALGDAIRSVVGETRIENKSVLMVVSKTPNFTGFNTPSEKTGQLEQIDVVKIPGANTIKVKFGYKTHNLNSSSIQTIQVASGEYDEDTFPSSIEYCNTTFTIVNLEFNNTDTITFKYYCSNTLYQGGYYAECIGYDKNGSVIEGNVEAEVEVPNTLTPLQMAEEINNLPPGPPESAFKTIGDCTYKFAYDNWDWFIDLYSDKIKTEDIQNMDHMFFRCISLKEIPFDINCKLNTSINANYAFYYCSTIENFPNINNLCPSRIDNMFEGCQKIKYFPENFGSNWDFSLFKNATSEYNQQSHALFKDCRNLRKIPSIFSSQDSINRKSYYSYCRYKEGFYGCYSLEEVQLPVYDTATWTSDAFNKCFDSTYRLKKIKFNLKEDGTPYNVNWKNQVISFTWVGCSQTKIPTSDFTDDTEITTEEQWRGYINGTYPDGYSKTLDYAVFGKTAATELINTLPNITATGTTNTVKFSSRAASAIPGEAMSELSEEVIAVAAAKGWTVTFV